MEDLFGLNDIDKIQAEIERDLETPEQEEPSYIVADFSNPDILLPQSLGEPDESIEIDEPPPLPSTDSFYRETIKNTTQANENNFFSSWGKVAVFLLICTLGTGTLGLGVGLGWGFISEGGRASTVLNGEAPFVATEPTTITTTHYVFSNVTNDPNAGSLADIVARLEPSVVGITAYFEGSFRGQNSGSGIIFAENDERIFIVTNDYVVSRSPRVTVSISGSEPLEARPVGQDNNTLLNVISVDKTQLVEAGIDSIVIATFGDSSQMRVGDTVLAIGNAMGEGNSVTRGVISAPEMNITFIDTTIKMLQTDAAINYGNSGGPLINTRGEVIGININLASNIIFGSALDNVEGMGYSIAANVATPILNNLINYRQPGLGISGQSVDEDIAHRWNIPVLGVFVDGVIPGRAAYNGGMLPDDIITGFNGLPVFNWEQLRTAIRNSEIGDTVEIRVLRNGREALTLTVTLDMLIIDNF